MRRLMLILIFPVLVIIWAIGWTLFHTGPQNNKRATRMKKQVKEEAVEVIGPIIDEEAVISEES
jgi:hypothetical protein